MKSFIICCVIFIILFGFFQVEFGEFIVAEALFDFLAWASFYIAIPLTALFFWAIHKKGNKFGKKKFFGFLDLENKLSHRIVSMPIFFFPILLFSFAFTANGIPAMLHFFSSERDEKIFIVSHKYSISRKYKITGGRAKNCISVAGATWLNGNVCYIKDDAWKKIKVGSSVTAVGGASAFGFKIENLYVDKNPDSDVTPDK